MGSTVESDRKRRHFSSASPTAAHMTKKLPFAFSSDDKKLDKAVLQYQNLKLSQKLEVQKIECCALEKNHCQVKDKQRSYECVLRTVKKTFEKLMIDLETSSSDLPQFHNHSPMAIPSPKKVDERSPLDHNFLHRLMDIGATERSSFSSCPPSQIGTPEPLRNHIEKVIQKIVCAITTLWNLMDEVYVAMLKELKDGGCVEQMSSDLESQVKCLRILYDEIHLKHKSLVLELQESRDIDFRNKAVIERIKGKVEELVAELADSSGELAALKAERDATQGAFFPVLNVGNKPSHCEKVKDKQKDVDELESSFKDLSEKASCRLMEIKCLHDERIRMLELSSNLQSSFKDFKSVCSSQVYLLLKDRLEKLRSELSQHQTILKKIQAEKENLAWKEKELNMRNDIIEVIRRCCAVADSRLADLGTDIQKQMDERNSLKSKLNEALKQPGRKHMISDFKALVSAFPEDMGNMQCQVTKFKQAAADINRLRAETQSLSSVLDSKENVCQSLAERSFKQISEVESLKFMLEGMRDSKSELKLILEMLKRESTDTRDFVQAKDMEYKSWADVEALKSSLDERRLELRVKSANEAEAISQQQLASAEAEIPNKRQKLEASRRDFAAISDAVKSKNEEIEAYLSEIETIGQAYDDIQTQNQHLLQQITERDDYNINLVLDRVKAKQLHDLILLQMKTLEKELHQARISHDFCNVKVARIEDQLKICTELVRKVAEDKSLSSLALANMNKKLQDMRRLMNQAKDTLEISQSKVEKGRASFLELQIEIETERFAKRRVEEDMEVLRRKVSYLQAQSDGSSVIEKLREELRKFKEITKCSVCFERPKEVVIVKCSHMFCHPCVLRILDSRHRKCPSCTVTFGGNDVKLVYL